MITLNTLLNNTIEEVTAFDINERTNTNKTNMLKLVYNGSAEAKKILDETLTVEAKDIISKQRTFLILSYAAGSQVGVTTKGANLASSLYSNPSQFFNKSTGKLSLKKIRKVLKFFGSNPGATGSGYKYNSVFVEGINKNMAEDKFGRANILCRVSTHEIRTFANRVRNLDVFICTEDDLKLIARDLDAICRALQELSIDVAKDASKNIGIDIHKLVNCKSNAHSDIIKKGDVRNNMDEGIKRILETDMLGDFKYSMAVTGFQFLKDVDSADGLSLADAIVEDSTGVAQEAINSGMTKAIDDVMELLKTCNGSKYSLYSTIIKMAKNPTTDEAVIIQHMIKMIVSAYNTIATMYSAKFNGYEVSSAQIRDFAKQVRSALYTEGAKFNVDQTDVVKYAIAAAFCYIGQDGNIYENKRGRVYAAKLVFPQEFVLEYIADGKINPREAVTTELTLVKTSTDLFVDDKLTFENGVCFTNDGGMVLVKEEYNGEAIVTAEGKLIALYDFYAYEEVGYVSLSSTCVDNTVDMTASTLVMPERINVQEDDERYNEEMTNRVFNSLGYVIVSGHMAIKNKDNSVTVVGTEITSHKYGRKPMGAITKQGGFICYTK